MKELSAKHESGEALSMEASREISRTPRRLPPCSDMSVLQKTRITHLWDMHQRLPAHLMSWPGIQKSLFRQA